MKPNSIAKCALAVVIAGSLAAGPVMAEKPSWAGSDKFDKSDKPAKKDKHEKGSKQRDDRRSDNDRSRRDGVEDRRAHFEGRHQVLVREYYSEARGGRCPPGLAKKNNGCLPPGQAKKWRYGQPLPSDVVYYPVPEPLVIQIGIPPSGYRYVRVAGDILMIAIGTGMVVDAIEDLGRM